MERARILKYLRIAVTALSLTACVLLITLWNWRSGLGVSLKGHLPGVSSFSLDSYHNVHDRFWQDVVVAYAFFEWASTSTSEWSIGEFEGIAGFIPEGFEIDIMSVAPSIYVSAPHWFLVLLSASFSTIPWLPWSKRFSLRTLLIATTLFAVGMGAVIYLAR